MIYHEKYLLISLEDNGIGINTNENTWGIGLKNINSRVEIIKAKIITDSSIKGATFIIEVLYAWTEIYLKMKYKLLIANDHTLFNEGVKQLLSDNYEIVA